MQSLKLSGGRPFVFTFSMSLQQCLLRLTAVLEGSIKSSTPCARFDIPLSLIPMKRGFLIRSPQVFYFRQVPLIRDIKIVEILEV